MNNSGGVLLMYHASSIKDKKTPEIRGEKLA